MSRYIDADKMISDTDNMRCICEAIEIDGIIKYIDEHSISNLKEVVVAENITKQHPVDEFICSNCGLIMRDLSRVVIDEESDNDESFYEFEFKYCPNCGADVRGKSHQ